MSADFSKLLAHLARSLEEHADRDGLSPVGRAVFLARGGHAPGEVCPTEPPAAPEQAWCYTCERLHAPMEWGDGCTDEGDVMPHHRVKREVVPGRWEVARPLRDTSWWHRWRQERGVPQDDRALLAPRRTHRLVVLRVLRRDGRHAAATVCLLHRVTCKEVSGIAYPGRPC